MTTEKHQNVLSEQKLKRRDFIQQGTRSLAGISLASGALPLLSLAGCATEDEMPEQNLAPVSHPLQGLTTLRGEKFELPPLIGQVTLLDFWASWCAPCRQAFRYLDQLYKAYLPDGLQMVGVCVDEEAAEGLRFANRMRVRFPLAWDGQQQVKERFAVQSLPTTFLLDQNGRLIHRHSGFDVRSHRMLDEQVRRLVRSV
ncbi:MAG: TlpA family protein disulfide reductase [Deltaproteobacteria bacterium]|nr:TlpA family protein disulfide reductase [Deltaproteobacteria bacterium]